MRRLVAMQLNLSDEVQARLGEILAADQAFQVRYEVIGALAREATRTKTCAPLVKFFADPEPVVVLRAVDALNASCTDLEDGVAQLVDWADLLAKPESHTQWHLPSRALSALARVAPESARSRLPAAMDHAVWQVRAAAATACVALSADAEAVALANDREANVRTAALQALVRLKSPAVFEASIRALKESTDYQLVLTAAQALKGAPEKARDEAAEVLLSVMRQLTERADDTSRDPRVALLERLGEILRPERSADLLPFMADFDDTVNAAALKAFGQLVGSPAAVPRPRRRYPYQPGEDAIGALPTAMTMEFDQGTVQIRLLTDVATVSVARIAALVSSGYYNGLTFHRIVPNFVVQGGSPGANEYVGVSRYMRDEVGPQAEHLRGAVGVSTRGRDTGDGQLFIDLVDLPRLDRDYTVFGYVTEGMDIVDRLLDGAVVRRVSVR
jgi:cyclophilin family peptidyl-prolyl cis-trans isomerase